jgi:pyruvate dehydrogenase E2 component (dihydrolipoamide acetyltransferase)
MATEIVMPQMGESITEGTITKWLKSVGEKVEKDEMIFEISTDKVDAEIPSPVAGRLLEIRGKEGETLQVGAVVAVVGEENEAGASTNVAPPNGNGESASAAAAAAAAVESNNHDAAQETAAAMSTDVDSIDSTPVSIDSTSAPAKENAAPVSTSSEGATEIVMPQMGESITEGTITKWLKSVGEKVEKDEMIFEISTDKVDAEIPSPVAGRLLEIRGKEGETLQVGAVVAVVGTQEGAARLTTATSPPQTPKANAATASTQTVGASQPSETEIEGRSYDYQRPQAVEEAIKSAIIPSTNIPSGNGNASVEELRRTKSSPLVRKIAKEHGIDISRLHGTGASGRVTKDDILNFIASGAALTPQQAMATAKTGADLPAVSAAQPVIVAEPLQQKVAAAPAVQPQTQMPPPVQIPAPSVGDRVEPMSVMRRKIAQHMTFSKQTSAHVTSVYEIDMTAVARFRDKNKNDFAARYGTKLTFMPFIFQAVTAALRKFPVVNAQVAGENIVYKSEINLGMAVALDWGLIVPVIKRADTLSLSGLALTANDLADRARAKKLLPDEVAGGTFTITNPGVFGGLFGTPIINQPQVAILCVGTIEKRPKVITSPEGDDYIAIRQMAYFALTYDHRIVDGADAEKFLSFVKEMLEAGQFAI